MKNKDYISRNEFEKLIQTFSKEESNEHLSDFDRDALEGWQQSNVSFSKMKQLDRKMNLPKINFTPYILGLSAVAILTLTFFLLSKTENASKTKKPLLVKLENTDIYIPEEIDTLEVIPQKDQITVSEIKTSQSEIKNLPMEEKKEEIMQNEMYHHQV